MEVVAVYGAAPDETVADVAVDIDVVVVHTAAAASAVAHVAVADGFYLHLYLIGYILCCLQFPLSYP
jgi:hypothetical protein